MPARDNSVASYAQQILTQVKTVVVGKDPVLLWVLAAILARGHILLEDIPGVGKTTMALAFSRVLSLSCSRVQFTPDVLPSDVTGYSVPDAAGEMRYQPGAVLCNLFLADELNRATSRTQSALLEAMETGKVSGYMTDFPTEAILGKPGIVCTPHLGASTPEAEDNCAAMAVQEISDYLKNGNITHSVNMPEVHQPRAGGKRICIIHKNEPGMISQITALTTEAGLNIENMVNKSKKNMAYTMLDATGAVDGRLAEKLAAIPAVIRVRIL